MEALSQKWATLTPARKLILAAAAVASIAAVYGIARLASQPSYALLYAGLEPSSAGQMISTLEQMNIPTRVDGDALYVPSNQRDEVRLRLAEQGLPRQGQSGYELLDGLSGFGTTAEMFDAAYWRAKEGELARTISALPNVTVARVHIATPRSAPFQRQRQGPTASVAVSTGATALRAEQAVAIRYLVALAVPGLRPENVTVIDPRTGVVLRPGDVSPTGGEVSDGVEREMALAREIEALVAARVGQGRVRVKASIDTDMARETVTERIVDPKGRVLRSSETEERTEQSTGTRGGAVTVASNLPDGDAAEGGNDSSSSSETRERVTYDASEVVRERHVPPGAVRRISLAVLIDEIPTEQADGTITWAPRPANELEAITELVKTAIGFDEARGDVVTVESMRFSEPFETVGSAPADGLTAALMRNIVPITQVGVLAITVLGLGLFVIRPILLGGTAGAEEDADDLDIETSMGLPDMSAEGAGALPAPGVGGVAMLADETGEDAPDRLSVLRETMTSRSDEAAALLKSWLELPVEQEDAA